MDETPHLVAHFMAAGAEKRLEDYCFLRNTYEKINGQEVQLNRILRMLGEDEINLNWRIGLSRIGRGRGRSAQDFDRWTNSLVLKGNIAYERLRDLEQDSSSKRLNPPTVPSSSRRVQELRDRRQRLSEQRDYPSGSIDRSGRARSQALAEYDTVIADWEAKRQQQAEENRLRTSRTEERQIIQPKFDKYKTIFEDNNDTNNKSKQKEEDISNNRTRKSSYSNEDFKRNQANNLLDNEEKSPIQSKKEKATDIELIAFTVRCQPITSSNKNANEQDTSVRLQCKWASPSSSSQIDYFTIEHQLGTTGEWQPVGDKIDKQENQTQLDIQSSIDENNDVNKNQPSYFRLKAHLQDGQTFTSKSTDGMFLNLFQDKNIIVPDVEILSPSSVQLTWKDPNENTNSINDNENIAENNESETNIYDVEKKEEQQNDWEKVLEVPLAQRSARIDSLTDATQCQFRLVPTNIESEETKQDDKSTAVSTQDHDESKQSLGSENDLQTTNIGEIDQSKDTSSENDLQNANIDELDQSKETSSENGLKKTNIDEVDQSKEILSENQSDLQETEGESDVLTVNNVNEWLDSLHITPTSPTTVDINISEEGFKDFDSYTIEYATADKPDQWKQMSNITQNDPHQAIDKLKQGTEYKFRFTPVLSDTTNETNSSQLSLILDVQTPTARRGRFDKDESETPVSTPPQFSIQKIDSTSVLIEANIPDEQPAVFEDVYDIYSKKDKDDDEDWTKVGTIDKDHLSTKVEDLEENTAYEFKIDNTTSPSSNDNQNTTVQQLKFDTTPIKQFDTSLLLEKIEQSLENVVNGVMQAAAGHQAIDEPISESLNDVIKEVFHDKNLVPNEEYGFDTLALNDDLQLYRGPKQMMLKELEINETSDLSKHEGEIIIHNYRTAQQSVFVREENGNTHVGNIDGDIIIRNVVSDVILKNDRTHHQLSMNIVGQAFLKGVQGSLIASKFKGIIVVKNVHKP